MNKEGIKITIITAAYNSVKTIEQTILSVIEQDYPYIEYIIIDGGSSDGTQDVIKRYEDKGIRWISEPDNDLYDALNKGVTMATGDYIEIIGSDDALYDKSIISQVVSQIGSDIDIISGQEMAVDEVSRRTFLCNDNNYARVKENYNGGMVGHAAMFVKKKILLKYKFDISYKIAADYKFFLQCYYDENVKIKYIDDVIAFFAIGGVSSNDKLLFYENMRINNELGLSLGNGSLGDNNKLIIYMKAVMRRLSIYYKIKKILNPLIMFVNRRFRWDKHYCNNKKCRWCGRV